MSLSAETQIHDPPGASWAGGGIQLKAAPKPQGNGSSDGHEPGA